MQLISKIKFSLLTAVVAVLTPAARGETFRTDINPALLCFQALMLRPDLSVPDRDYLFTNEWRGQHLMARFGDLIGRYGNEFKLLRRAARSKVPCDWGIDIGDGPETLLPQLAPCKQVAQTARLRALWDLQNGNPIEARDDLVSACALARNVPQDGTLISCLVQIAMESITCSSVAENYGAFPARTLQELVDGIDASPARRTVADCVPAERGMFVDGWLIPKLRSIQQSNSSDEPRAWKEIMVLFGQMIGGEETNSTFRMDDLAKASGATSDGVLRLARELSPFYDRLARVLALPYPQYDAEIAELVADIQKSPNPLAREFLPAFAKCRSREFVVLVKLAMVRAAVQYKLHGAEGLKSITDPCGHGPFAFEPFTLNGVLRGFKLTSAYPGPGFNSLIFVEKEGVPFYIEGKTIGQPIQQN